MHDRRRHADARPARVGLALLPRAAGYDPSTAPCSEASSSAWTATRPASIAVSTLPLRPARACVGMRRPRHVRRSGAARRGDGQRPLRTARRDLSTARGRRRQAWAGRAAGRADRGGPAERLAIARVLSASAAATRRLHRSAFVVGGGGRDPRRAAGRAEPRPRQLGPRAERTRDAPVPHAALTATLPVAAPAAPLRLPAVAGLGRPSARRAGPAARRRSRRRAPSPSGIDADRSSHVH